MPDTLVRIRNLSGAFTGAGFRAKDGRFPTIDDCGFVEGPLDIVCCSQSGRIIGVSADSNASGSEGVVDGTGMIATAGFIDSHTHAIFAGNRASEFFRRWSGTSYTQIAAEGGGICNTIEQTSRCPDDELRTLLAERLRRMRRQGTTVAEVKTGYGGTPEGELRLLRAIQQIKGQTDLPEVRSTFLGLHALAPGQSESEYCTAMIDVLDVVAEQNLASYVDAFPERGFFSLQAAEKFAMAALERGLGVKIHADELSDMGAAESFAKLGALSVDHLQHVSPRAIEVLGESNTVATLLPATSFYLRLPYANARKLIDAGVRVALASDFNPGTAPESRLQFTSMLAAAKLSMKAPEIFCALTFNAAAALGIENDYGLICPGFKAHLQLWSIDTTSASIDPMRNLENILMEACPRFVHVM